MFRARRANRVLSAVACAVLSAANSKISAGDSGLYSATTADADISESLSL
jgi:hypothetical protein